MTVLLVILALLYLGAKFFIFSFWLALKTEELDKQRNDKK